MEEDQTKCLEDAISVVKDESYHMQRALDSNNLNEALKHASNMIGELRTSLLSPRSYYELYMQVFDQLSRIEAFFREESRRGTRIVELYEKVQHTISILPRLYLLITVGSVYIQTKELPAKDILKDLIEMVKGVQHPLRGLFLRYYLNKVCKDKLPDKGSDFGDGDVTDSIDFLVQNLSEMNRLWIRMQHTGSVKDKTKREKERNDLRVTVGENINRLSSLQGVNIDVYQELVLPKILEIVVSNKDAISQQYLMDCIIQAFSDDFHLHTLQPLLEACSNLQPTVDIQSIVITLLNRLSDYAGEAELEVVQRIDIFGLIKAYIDKVVADQESSLDTKKLLLLQVAFMKLSLKCYPLNTNNVNTILESCVSLIDKSTPENRVHPESLKSIVKLLSFPLETLSFAILTLNNYPKLMTYLPFSSRKQVAFKIVQSVVVSKKSLDTFETTTQLLEFVSPLLFDTSDSEEGADAYEFEDEQNTMAKLSHLVKSADLDTHYKILSLLKQRFAQGGDKRIKYTFPSLIFAYINFAKLLNASEDSWNTHLEQVLEVLAELVSKTSENNPDLALKLNLQCLQLINQFKNNKYQHTALEFVEHAFYVYKEELADSYAKHAAIDLICATLVTLNCFDDDTSDSLVKLCTQQALRQLKKHDQCTGLSSCTHLFYNEFNQNERIISDCLGKAVKIAEICITHKNAVNLYLTLINKYLYYLLQGVSTLEEDSVNQLIQATKDSIATAEKEGDNRVNVKDIKSYLRATLNYIKARQQEGKLSGISV
mmetsp:Transcript_8705/g.8722  ORF Transcript_8705/g.8722 Transcript_8705/m.8722 type:complete len:770 (+) Transcript_8705:10-2319(+)|eukprot:CAMPEP_0202948634 /NCGR_PEP_ID=MMETSP1395-20130829/13964_1 /ASSEMBLY_ACC=CAM_ASM_000871 /TAXON_ID=5961 /ORGANISM="Blepharisma japonicum, Strain Stock R1072" /LENGTH=769 /DNA_ID=CAMNT_0049650865 /DNA_START=6 /DNA_END=2315 /DNA_ORIENTATION=+